MSGRLAQKWSKSNYFDFIHLTICLTFVWLHPAHKREQTIELTHERWKFAVDRKFIISALTENVKKAFSLTKSLIDDKIDSSTPPSRPISRKLRFITENLFMVSHGFAFILIPRPRMTSMPEQSQHPVINYSRTFLITWKHDVQHGWYLHSHPNSLGIVF